MQSSDQISNRWIEIEAGHFWHLRIAAMECGDGKGTIY
jgi:hypothetical protein